MAKHSRTTPSGPNAHYEQFSTFGAKPTEMALHLYSEASHGKHRSQVLRPCSSLRDLARRFGLRPRLNTRKFSGITEQSKKSRKYVVLEFRDVCVLFRDVSAGSGEGEARSGEQAFGLRTVFSVGGNTINDEGGMARDE